MENQPTGQHAEDETQTRQRIDLRKRIFMQHPKPEEVRRNHQRYGDHQPEIEDYMMPDEGPAPFPFQTLHG